VALWRLPAGQEFGCSRAAPGEAFGVQVVPDGQVKQPELAADSELLRVDGIAISGQDARAVQTLTPKPAAAETAAQTAAADVIGDIHPLFGAVAKPGVV
jgi:hypothetical protein